MASGRGGPAHRLDVGGVTFVSSWVDGASTDGVRVDKEPELLAAYADLLERFAGGNLVELGIHEGGSTLLVGLQAAPRCLVAIDLTPTPVAALESALDHHDLRGSVHPHYGVDQADRARLAAIVDDAVGGAPLDLVIDDASHLYDETRASFEVLFPRLRPGGWYVIEDWNWVHRTAEALARSPEAEGPVAEGMRRLLRGVEDGGRPPLHALALELVLARASMGREVGQVRIDPWWVVVERGDAPLDPETFSLDALVHDRSDLLALPADGT